MSTERSITRSGYIFDGWYWDEDIWAQPFTAESLLTVKLTGNMSVYAKWLNEDVTKRDYAVTFDTMGYGEVESQRVLYGTLATKPTAPERPGYALVGWYREADLTTVWNFKVDAVTEDTTLYAKWVPSSDAAGCAVIDSGEMTMDGKTLSIELPNAQTTFAFGEQLTVSPYAQYEVSTDLAGKDVIPSATVELEEGDNVFYIQIVSGTGSNRDQYKAVVRRREIYTVTYNFGGGAADATEQVEEDQLAPSKDASREGYTFGGWQHQGEAWDFAADKVVGDMTLTAVWNANGYQVTFDSAGGNEIDVAEVTFGEEFTLEVPTRLGYTFGGWKTEDEVLLTDGEGVGVGAWDIAADTALTATWTVNTYNIEYKNMDGALNAESNPASYTIEDDDITLAAPTKTGYTFVGWTSDEAGEEAVTTLDTSACEDVELWAQWTVNSYTATFVADGETVDEVEFTVEDEALTEPTVPSKVGYTGKWEEYDIVADDITVEAVYTAIVYDVEYVGLEDGTHSNASEYTIESETIVLQDASRVGYDFVGWYDGEQEVTEIASGSHGDKTLTAKWQIVEYSVGYVLDGGVNAASNPTSYTVLTLGGADGSIALVDPSKKGEILSYTSNGDGSVEVTQNVYTFLGWYKDPSFEQKVTSLTLDLGDVTLYAKWSEPVAQTETKQYVRVDENNEMDEQGKYILFGEYPQTIKSSDVTVGDVADEDGYYLGSDGERYAKVVADPYNSGYTFSDGSDVTNGETYYFKVEPIRWRILSESDGSAFIMADGIIANSRYAPNYNDYADSDIRAWLNGEFLNTAFGEVAQILIETTEVDNSVYSTGYSSNSYACENTFDKVFLLSYREVTNSEYGFASSSSTYDTARRMTVSDYARSTGAYMNTSSSYFGCGIWWLRSPDDRYSDLARSVYDSGRGGIDYSVSSGNGGVVPALNITL